MNCEKGLGGPSKFIGTVIGTDGIIAIPVGRKVDVADVADRGIIYSNRKVTCFERLAEIPVATTNRTFIDIMNA